MNAELQVRDSCAFRHLVHNPSGDLRRLNHVLSLGFHPPLLLRPTSGQSLARPPTRQSYASKGFRRNRGGRAAFVCPKSLVQGARAGAAVDLVEKVL
jgi:hypothetical protein